MHRTPYHANHRQPRVSEPAQPVRQGEPAAPATLKALEQQDPARFKFFVRRLEKILEPYYRFP